MTKLDAVIFVFTVGAIPCVLEAFTWLAAENRRVARAAVAAALVVVAENEQLSHRPWQSGAILVAATFFAAFSPSLRRRASSLPSPRRISSGRGSRPFERAFG